MRREQKFAISILILGAVIAAPFLTGKLIINVSPSVPVGLWLKVEGEIKCGDIVQVPFDAFKSTEWVPEEYYRKSFWGNNVPFLKRVAGLPGDEIKNLPDGFIALSHDGLGNELKTYPLPIILESDEVWLMSDAERGFDSRYLGPAKIIKCHKVIPLITH